PGKPCRVAPQGASTWDAITKRVAPQLVTNAAPAPPARSAPREALRGDNGSAFFSRLPFRAKSAMAEILVSDQCDDCPPRLAEIERPEQRPDAGNGGPALAVAQPTRRNRCPTSCMHSPGFSDCSDCSAHCFFHCLPLFLRLAFSAAHAKPCIVIGAHFPL